MKKCSDFILRYCMALKATGVHGVVTVSYTHIDVYKRQG